MASKKETKKEEKTVEKVDYSSWNVIRKLQEARLMFLERGVKKTGKNLSGAGYMYFELADIVPEATAIFRELGLLMVPEFGEDRSTATVYNADNPEESIVFNAPFDRVDPIVSNAGKQVTNKMQALGSSITYMRRYLWMIVLDIIETDEIDSGLQNPADLSPLSVAASTPAPAPKAAPAAPEVKADAPQVKPLSLKRNAPVAAETREEIKAEMTAAPADQASPESVAKLKSLLKILRATDPTQESFVQAVVVKTQAFKKLTEPACAQIITGVEQMLAAYDKEG